MLHKSIIQSANFSSGLVDEALIEKTLSLEPEIFKLQAASDKPKAVVVISPGMCTRQLHLKKPFVGYQLSRMNYLVYSVNTLDLENYGLSASDPWERQKLTEKAYDYIHDLHPNQKIISLGHSLGCIDLLRAQPKVQASVFLSPGFKGDKSKFGLPMVYAYLSSVFQRKDLKLQAHGMKDKPELSEYKSDFINPVFLWNLQKYAHGLEKTHFWPLEKPCLMWLGSKAASDGVMEMKQPLSWINQMKKKNEQSNFLFDPEAGHEPGWRNALHSERLARQIDNWILENVL